MTETSGDLMTQLISSGYIQSRDNPSVFQLHDGKMLVSRIKLNELQSIEYASQFRDPYVARGNTTYIEKTDSQSKYRLIPTILNITPTSYIRPVNANEEINGFYGYDIQSEIDNNSNHNPGNVFNIKVGTFRVKDATFSGFQIEDRSNYSKIQEKGDNKQLKQSRYIDLLTKLGIPSDSLENKAKIIYNLSERKLFYGNLSDNNYIQFKDNTILNSLNEYLQSTHPSAIRPGTEYSKIGGLSIEESVVRIDLKDPNSTTQSINGHINAQKFIDNPNNFLKVIESGQSTLSDSVDFQWPVFRPRHPIRKKKRY